MLEEFLSLSILAMPAGAVSALPAAASDQFSRLIHRQLTRAETIALCALLILPPTIHFLRRATHDYESSTLDGQQPAIVPSRRKTIGRNSPDCFWVSIISSNAPPRT